MRKSSLGVLIAALGWIINLPYWVNEILIKDHNVLAPIREVLLEHLLVGSTIPVFMVVGYLFYKQAVMEEKLREYTEFLAQKVEERTRELTEANEKLKATYEELRELNDLKDALIANVSHELRTPITIAKGALDLAMEEKNPERRERLLNMAMEALERQNRIVGDLITYHERRKPGAGEMADIEWVVDMGVGMFRKAAEKKGMRIEVLKPAEDRLPLVKGDPEKVLHVLGNLLDNAIKFSREGGKVVVEAARKNGDVEVCVSDTGVGIPRYKLSRVFDRFYQVDPGLTRRYGGTGMGLAVAREIVEGYGGGIRVESEEGKGSRFCFTLPAVEG